MSGRTRRILLLVLALVIFGAVFFALFTLRGLDGLPLIGGSSPKPEVTEAPVETPTPEPSEEPVEVLVPEPTPAAVTAVPALPEPTAEDEGLISSMAGTLHTAAGELRYKTEILSAQQGEDADQMSLGHVYAKRAALRVRLLEADGSVRQELESVELSGENIYQEAFGLDLNGDGSDELVIRLHTYEGERAVLLFVWDANSERYVPVSIREGEALTWSSDFDAATNQLWYRHGTKTLLYDCYELQGTQLVLVRRLEDAREKDEDERFSEYTYDGNRQLTVQESVPAAAIDTAKWSFVTFH